MRGWLAFLVWFIGAMVPIYCLQANDEGLLKSPWRRVALLYKVLLQFAGMGPLESKLG